MKRAIGIGAGVVCALIAIWLLVVMNCSNLELDHPESLIVYSIDGGDHRNRPKPKANDEEFHGYVVLGKVEVADAAQRKAIVDALNVGMAEGKLMADCFNPRHGIRAVQTGVVLDLIICFECRQIDRQAASLHDVRPISERPKSLLDNVLMKGGVRLAN